MRLRVKLGDIFPPALENQVGIISTLVQANIYEKFTLLILTD